MRAVIQRVTKSTLRIDGVEYSSIGKGLVVLLGIGLHDTKEDVEWLATKIAGLRIFSDEEQKMNLDVNQVQGEIMAVSQFTLFASTKKGNRPSFLDSAKHELAVPLYDYFIECLGKHVFNPPKTGQFGEDMQIELINDGPVTIIIDTKNKE